MHHHNPVWWKLWHSTLLSTNHKTADRSKFDAVISLVERSVESLNFHCTGDSKMVFARPASLTRTVLTLKIDRGWKLSIYGKYENNATLERNLSQQGWQLQWRLKQPITFSLQMNNFCISQAARKLLQNKLLPSTVAIRKYVCVWKRSWLKRSIM